MEKILTTNFGLWINACSNTDNALHGSSKAVVKCGILPQREKQIGSSNGNLTHYVFNLEEAVTHLVVSNPSSTLTIEKYAIQSCFYCYRRL